MDTHPTPSNVSERLALPALWSPQDGSGRELKVLVINQHYDVEAKRALIRGLDDDDVPYYKIVSLNQIRLLP